MAANNWGDFPVVESGSFVTVDTPADLPVDSFLGESYVSLSDSSLYIFDGTVWVNISNGGGGGAGTVTSVGLTMPTGFSVAHSPVASSGTIAVSYTPEAAGLVLAGPVSGAADTPSFRALAAQDVSGIVGLRGGNAPWTTGTNLTVTHGWGTRKVMVQVLDLDNNYANIELDSVTRPTDNTVALVASQAPPSSWLVLLREVP